MSLDSTRINMGDLIINNGDHSSSISFGSNVKVGRNVSAKKNQAFGQQLSDCTVQFFPISVILDDDSNDFFNIKQSNIE